MTGGSPAPTVLVVDDDETTLQLIRALLEEAGFEVAVRSEALGTTAEIQRSKPDFVLLDVNMPALTGDRIARVLSSGERLGSTRLIFYSGRTEEELAQLARAHDAHGWIRKSTDHAQFVREFQRLASEAQDASTRETDP